MKPSSLRNNAMAYVAVLSTDSFLDGVLVLQESLRLSRSSYPLYVVVGSKVGRAARQTLARAKVEQIIAGELDLPDYIRSANAQSDHHKHWSGVFDKLHVFSLTQFDKIVYIDSDVLVVRNIDDLFGYDHMSATRAGELPGRDDSVDFSTGLMVIEPAPGLTDEIVALLPEAYESERRWRAAAGRPMSLGVQGVINMRWPEWMEAIHLHLDAKYNVMATHLDYYVSQRGYRLRGPDAIRVLHFDGELKPWMTAGLGSIRQAARLLARRRKWEVAALLAYKAVLQDARLRLTLSREL